MNAASWDIAIDRAKQRERIEREITELLEDGAAKWVDFETDMVSAGDQLYAKVMAALKMMEELKYL